MGKTFLGPGKKAKVKDRPGCTAKRTVGRNKSGQSGQRAFKR